jgi:hypothetical protein
MIAKATAHGEDQENRRGLGNLHGASGADEAPIKVEAPSDRVATCSRCTEEALWVWCEACAAPFCQKCDTSWHGASASRRAHLRNSLCRQDDTDSEGEGEGEGVGEGEGRTRSRDKGGGERAGARASGTERHSLLHIAGLYGHESVVEAFVSQGGSHEALNERDGLGRTPLHIAAVQGHASLSRRLVREGVSPTSSASLVPVSPPAATAATADADAADTDALEGQRQSKNVQSAGSAAMMGTPPTARRTPRSSQNIGTPHVWRSPLRAAMSAGKHDAARAMRLESESQKAMARKKAELLLGTAATGIQQSGARVGEAGGVAKASSASKAARGGGQEAGGARTTPRAGLGGNGAGNGDNRGNGASAQREGGREGGRETSRVKNWRKGDLLGSGAFGNVYSCMNEDTGEVKTRKRREWEEGSGREGGGGGVRVVAWGGVGLRVLCLFEMEKRGNENGKG